MFRVALLALVATGVLMPASALAAPEAHLLRIDPRASLADGAPVLTTVIELVQHKRLSTVTAACAQATSFAQYRCVADQLEKPNALYDPFAFPDQNALFTITVDGTDVPATLVSQSRWGESKGQEGVGTAWLVLVDADGTMGSRFGEAKGVARAFIDALGPNDIVNLVYFNDRTVVKDSRWVKEKAKALATLDSVTGTFRRSGRTRPLFNIIKQAATDGFKELGNTGTLDVPMHQAMVVLSNGHSGADPGSTSQSALVLQQYLSSGRFPEDNTTLPKAPVPVVSVWFPARQEEEFFQNAHQFMENLANPSIGGFHSIVLDGEAHRAARIVKAVHTRFDQMHIVKWRVACVAPTVSQTFKLVFNSTNPPIAGDNFIDVPVGIDPTTWPLDVDFETTLSSAKKAPVYPGGTVKVFGNFCWGSDHERAQLYMIPKNQPAPESLKGQSVSDAQAMQKALVASGLVGDAIKSGDTFVEFTVPDSTKFLSGKDDAMTARLVVYDSASKRTSAVTADKILTLPASEAPLNLWLIGGLTFGGVVLLLLVIQVFRGGGGGGRRERAPVAAPRPVVAAAPSPGSPFAAAPDPGFGGPGGAPGFAAGPPAFGAGPPPGAGAASSATLSGQPGIYPVTPGREVRVGRDPSQCDICLTEPRISGVHATLMMEGGVLYVRDDGSNNGTFIDSNKLPPHVFTPVAGGATLKFGPIEFSVRLD